MWPTFAAELIDARASLRLADEVGLAVRADRRRLGMSQRAYAAHRGLTLSAVIRLESAAGGMKLADVVAALDGTAFVLCLCHRPPSDEPAPAAAVPVLPDPAVRQPPATTALETGSLARARPTAAPPPGPTDPATQPPPAPPLQPPPDPPAPRPVSPAFWPRSELIARVRGGGRRFPAHHDTEQVSSAPPWWWYAESSRAGTVPPDWYAPRFTRRGDRAC
ncbi:hypothetical protein GCM10023168_23080 [Fodinibacter luteus]|uniref:Helix-turn-helix protein n=1 Tax=Fodinibacter luteus TaxID=552064 RepID=A0ABP8KI62_9MICO